MALFNCFLNFNMNFGQPRFGLNFGCFSMPNFFSSMPIFNFNNISTFPFFQQYNNLSELNTPNPFIYTSNMPTPTMNYTSVFENDSFSNAWLYNNLAMPSFDTFNWSYDTKSKTKKKTKTEATTLQLKLVEEASSYVGEINSDSKGNRLFSNGKSQNWCADFVTYNVKKVYKDKLPSSFGSSSVSELRNWGEENNCYLKIPTSNKSSFIAENIKPGDIMIEKRNGKSHTGIVTKVNSDGSFETVEGNSSNSVKKCTYEANSNTLSGFISLSEYA